MENPEESVRLDVKTDVEAVRNQAVWCGVKPGLRILDLGCGSGKTSSILHEMIKPQGSLVGVDMSEDRIRYAKENFGRSSGIEFLVRDFCKPLIDLGSFDLIWVQFVLEYFRKEAIDILKNLTTCLKPEGLLCLLDLDNNCLNQYPMTGPMEVVIKNIIQKLEKDYNFDPYTGRKLYTYLYDLNYRDIQVHLMPHHLIHGELRPQDHFNWNLKLKVASEKAPDVFDNYPGGKDAFFDDFGKYFRDPRRFVYSPLIIGKGKRPVSA
ncbi:class I SAM-dependent methyltransferase [Thermodesulfobacteriota bacterium]